MIRFEHTVFALPFAYVGALLSVDSWPGWDVMAWVTVAMVGARTLAMSLNRLMDAELDARNPRTATRELPTGALTRGTGVGALRGCARRIPRQRSSPSTRSFAGCGRSLSPSSSSIPT